MRKFFVSWVVECELELDENVINVVDDDWRKYLYNLNTAEEIAEHLAYNFVMNRTRLSMLDGWANMKDTQAETVSLDTYDWQSKEIAK